MPAISPARLKKDVAQLIGIVGEPELFDRELEHLMEFYADRTIRPSQTGMPASLLPAYHVPRPVLREIEVNLSRYAAVDADGALRLGHRLWTQGYYEYMLLAVRLFERLPGTHTGAVLRNLKSWAQTTDDEELLEEIFRIASERDVADLMNFLETLLEARLPALNATALVGLTAVARHGAADAIPGVYKLTGLAMQNQALERRAKMVTLVQALAERTPAETAFFMRQQYLVSMRPEIGRLLRHCLTYFPEDIRADLRAMLRENKV